MKANILRKCFSGVAIFGALAGLVPSAYAALPTTGSCGILGAIPHPYLTPTPGLTVNLDFLAVINFANSTISYNFIRITDNSPAANTISQASGSVPFTTGTGPVAGSYTITFLGVGSNQFILNVLPVNSGNTFLIQGANDRISGVCQMI